MYKRIVIIIIETLVGFATVYYFKNNTQTLQETYAQKIYPAIASTLRSLWGGFPFSVGDFLYLLLIGLLLYLLLMLVLSPRLYWQHFLVNITLITISFIILFYFLWGYNYYNPPLKQRLNYTVTYNEEQLLATTTFLVRRANALQEKLAIQPNQKVVFTDDFYTIAQKVAKAYEKASRTYIFLKYEPVSIKKSAYSKLLAYMGYSGYLNPFTGEAQVNKNIPAHTLPFTAAHEVGHQIGFASEGDANFIAYLVLLQSDDLYLQYSATIFALRNLLYELRKANNEQYKTIHEQVNKGILLSYEENQQYWLSHQNPIEPLLKFFYDQFLKINNQQQGILSYNLVSELIIAHHKNELL